MTPATATATMTPATATAAPPPPTTLRLPCARAAMAATVLNVVLSSGVYDDAGAPGKVVCYPATAAGGGAAAAADAAPAATGVRNRRAVTTTATTTTAAVSVPEQKRRRVAGAVCQRVARTQATLTNPAALPPPTDARDAHKDAYYRAEAAKRAADIVLRPSQLVASGQFRAVPSRRVTNAAGRPVAPPPPPPPAPPSGSAIADGDAIISAGSMRRLSEYILSVTSQSAAPSAAAAGGGGGASGTAMVALDRTATDWLMSRERKVNPYRFADNLNMMSDAFRTHAKKYPAPLRAAAAAAADTDSAGGAGGDNRGYAADVNARDRALMADIDTAIGSHFVMSAVTSLLRSENVLSMPGFECTPDVMRKVREALPVWTFSYEAAMLREPGLFAVGDVSFDDGGSLDADAHRRANSAEWQRRRRHVATLPCYNNEKCMAMDAKIPGNRELGGGGRVLMGCMQPAEWDVFLATGARSANKRPCVLCAHRDVCISYMNTYALSTEVASGKYFNTFRNLVDCEEGFDRVRCILETEGWCGVFGAVWQPSIFSLRAYVDDAGVYRIDHSAMLHRPSRRQQAALEAALAPDDDDIVANDSLAPGPPPAAAAAGGGAYTSSVYRSATAKRRAQGERDAVLAEGRSLYHESVDRLMHARAAPLTPPSPSFLG
jgi:hypothetical protein